MTNLICSLCHNTYPFDTRVYQCTCGGLLDLDFHPVFDRVKIAARKPGMWRYREALPVIDDASITSFEEGFTPLLPVEISGQPIWVKQDHLFPSGSYKDRGASLLISHAREIGV
ncbi:MAG: threonine synthase, partial [Anaerolineaceae bacterium]|nr:threonine synthase [Anaerolineaceae bacterium]